MGILDECREHMEHLNKWTSEASKKSALKYKSRWQWKKHAAGAYKAAKRLGIKDECCEHVTGQKNLL